MKIYTIGFTGKTAEEFFDLLNTTDAEYLVDIRLNNNSQLAGFTKRGNIDYFTERLTGLTYLEMPIFAPEPEAFKQFRSDGDWEAYEARYAKMLRDRDVTAGIDVEVFRKGAVLLCSERTAEKCHRRLVAEHLLETVFPHAEIGHL